MQTTTVTNSIYNRFKNELVFLLFSRSPTENIFDDEVKDANDAGDDCEQEGENIDQEVLVPREVVNRRLEMAKTWNQSDSLSRFGNKN
jgi:hypothetical protein